MKNELIQSIGIIIVLIGVLLLALAGFGIAGSTSSNTWMGSGLLLIIVGMVTHIAVNKKVL